MTPKSQIHPPGLVPQILLRFRRSGRLSAIRRGGVLPRPFCRYARHCRSTHSFHPCPVGRLPSSRRPLTHRTPCKKPCHCETSAHAGLAIRIPYPQKNPAPPGRIFLWLSEKPSGFFDRLSYFFSASTPLRRAATFSSVVAQLAAKRIAEWVSSTRSQYS